MLSTSSNKRLTAATATATATATRQKKSANSGGDSPSSSSSSSSLSSSTLLGSAISVGTKALAIYGAYQLVSLAYDTWNGSGSSMRSNEKEEEEEEEAHLVILEELQQRRRQSPLSSPASPPLKSSKPVSIFSASLWTSLFWKGPDTRQDHPPQQRPQRDATCIRKRRLQLRKCRIQVRQVLCRLIPTVVKRTIYQATDFSKERQALKELRTSRNGGDLLEQQQQQQQQGRLWKMIQRQTMTRFVVTIYAPTILFCVLTVQVAVIMGRMQKERGIARGGGVANNKDDNENEYLSDFQWVLEQTYQYMFQQGLPSLLDSVQRILRDDKILASQIDYPLLADQKTADAKATAVESEIATAPITQEQLKNILQQVDMRLRHDATLQRERSLLRFVQPPSVIVDDDDDDNDDNSSHSSQQRRMDLLDETWDMLESPMVDDAVAEALQVLRQRLVQQAFTNVVVVASSSSATESGNDDTNNTSVVKQDLPLAQALAGMKHACQSLFGAFDVPQTLQTNQHKHKNDNSYEGSHDNQNNNDKYSNDHHGNDNDKDDKQLPTSSSTNWASQGNEYLKAWERLPPVLETMDVCFDG